MRIKRSIFALICTSTLIFAGCSAADSDGSPADNAAESGGSDSSGDSGDSSETSDAPEPDVADVPDVVATEAVSCSI